MADFSHLEAIGIQMQIDRICKGEKLGDHELLKIVRYFDPPLLNPEEMDVVVNELDASHSRKRGRPTGMVAPRKLLADSIGNISRPDVPDKFLKVLTSRLRSGRRFPFSSRNRKASQTGRTTNKQMIIRGLYHDVKEAMELAKTQIKYPEMEPFEFPEEPESYPLHKRAVQATQHILRTYLDVDPPSEGRMLNIISGQR